MSGPLAIANTYRFASKEWNANAGLYYFGRRYYDPMLQRWPNRDPIQEMGGLNLYAYVLNSPINFIDPLGENLGIPGASPGYGSEPTPQNIVPANMQATQPANYSAANPTGHGVILFDSGVSYFALGGGGGGTQTILLDNGQVVSYGYLGGGVGFGKGGGNFGLGEVYGVYQPTDYEGPFVNVSAGLGVSGGGISSFPGGAASYSAGAGTTGINGSLQLYWIIDATDPIVFPPTQPVSPKKPGC
jgi:RHS repeat-associated protein